MKNLKWFVLATALVVSAAVPAVLAQEAGPPAPAADEPTLDVLTGEWALVIVECKLSERQQAALRAKLRDRARALAAWDQANAGQLQAANDVIKKAKQAKDKAAEATAKQDLKAIEAERSRKYAEATAAVYTVLTPEQKAAWETFRLYRLMMTHFKKCNLTEEQTARVRETCAAAVKRLGPVVTDPDAFKTAQVEARTDLEMIITDTILAPEQRAAMTAKKGKGAAPSTPPAPAP